MLVGVAYTGAGRTFYAKCFTDCGRNRLVLIRKGEHLDHGQGFAFLQAQVFIVDNGIAIYR
jgi:hypothetical protein